MNRARTTHSKTLVGSLLFTAFISGNLGCSNAEEPASPVTLHAELVQKGTIFVEAGASYPAGPALVVSGADEGTTIGVHLAGEARFADGADELSFSLSPSGTIELPAIVGGRASEDSTISFDADGVELATMRVMTVEAGGIARIRGMLSGDTGVTKMAEKFAVLDEEKIQTSNEVGSYSSDNVDFQVRGACVCAYKGNIGLIKMNSSTKGKVAMWLIPEDGKAAAFTPPTSNTTYQADGFKIGSQIYKIDGSTCSDMSYANGRWSLSTCVNALAKLAGKKAPYPVKNGTFGNEPPANKAAQYVR